MILFLSINDWANVGYSLSEAAKQVGLKTKAITTGQNWFDYPDHSEHISSFDKLKPELDNAEVIVFMHSAPQLLEMPYNFRKKRCIVFHGGTEYRQNPKLINDLFNPIIDMAFVQTGNLLELGAKNEKWLIPPIDTQKINPVYDSHYKYPIIGHFPRNPMVKGTIAINRVIKEIGHGNYLYFFSPYQVGWEENIRRNSRCDICISALKPELDGKLYGGGIEVTDLECAALGKIVITHFSKINRYREEFGECPFFVANNEYELKKQIEKTLILSKEQKRKIQIKTRKWVEDNYSFKAVGERLKTLIYDN